MSKRNKKFDNLDIISTPQEAPSNTIFGPVKNREGENALKSIASQDYESKKEAGSMNVRRNQGLSIRIDQIKRLKRIALEEDRKFYQVVEEAFEEYLERHE